MSAQIWPHVVQAAAAVAARLDGREPATLPRWLWAALLVAVVVVLARVGGRILVGLLQICLVAAAVLVAWQMLQVPAASPASRVPPACVLEGTCGTPASATAGAPAAPTGHAMQLSAPERAPS